MNSFGKSCLRFSEAKANFSDSNFLYIYLLRQEDVRSENCCFSDLPARGRVFPRRYIPGGYGSYRTQLPLLL